MRLSGRAVGAGLALGAALGAWGWRARGPGASAGASRGEPPVRPPSSADRLAAEAKQALAFGDRVRAGELARESLASDSSNLDARAVLRVASGTSLGESRPAGRGRIIGRAFTAEEHLRRGEEAEAERLARGRLARDPKDLGAQGVLSVLDLRRSLKRRAAGPRPR